MVDISFRYKVALSCIVIMMVFVTLSGFSYAYFTATINGKESDSGKDWNVSAEGINVTYNNGNGNAINLTNEKPISDSDGLNKTPYTFTVKNNNSYAVSLKFYLTVDKDDIPVGNIKYGFGTAKPASNTGTLLSDNKSTDTTLVSGKTSYLLGSLDSLANGTTSSTYNLWLWIDNAVSYTQTCDIGSGNSCETSTSGTIMGKSFQAHITVKVEQIGTHAQTTKPVTDQASTEGPQIFDDPSEISGNNSEVVVPEVTEPEVTEPENVNSTESEIPENDVPVVEEPGIEDIPQNGEGMEGPSIG